MITGTLEKVKVTDYDGDKMELREVWRTGLPVLLANASVMGCHITREDALTLGIFLILWAVNEEEGE